MQPEFFTTAYSCLLTSNVDNKITQVAAFNDAWKQAQFSFQPVQSPVIDIPVPGRPLKPELVSALAVNKRKLSTPAGRASLVHALAHIEFNAINLALDAIYRFRDLPSEFYNDWLKVAAEEAGHFVMLRDYLRSQGYDYGDFSAHNGLWDMALVTAHDPLVRMALVPSSLSGLKCMPHTSMLQYTL